jgi:hypothetical protein
VLTAPGQVKSIALGHDAANNDRVFAVGLDSQVWEQTFGSQHTPSGSWSLTQPGQVLSIAVAGNPDSGVPILGAIGLDSQMWQQPLGPSGQSLGGWQLVAPGPVRQVIPDYLGFYAIGLDQQFLKVDYTTPTHQLIGTNFRVQDAGVVHWSYFVVGTTRQVQTATLLQGLDSQLWLATTVSPLTLTAPGQIL